MSVAEIYRIVKQAIVKVTTVGKSVDSGTGFIVSPLGYIVTCYHVIDKAEKIEITLNSLDISIDAQVIGYDTTTDIAILKADVKFDEFLPLGHSEDLKTGENVLMFGYPLVSGHRTEKEPTIFETTVSNATPAYFKLRGAAGIGASGGPIYSVEQEAVVGVIAKELTQITIDYEVHTTGNASFAVPIHRCRQLLQDLVSAYKQVSSKEYVDQFVNRVADIYRAQGFDIETDISLGAGEVLDLYATTQFGGTSLRLGISCLYQLDMVTAESIREKLPTFLLAKKLPSPIDKNIVISNSPFSIEAKEIASRSDIDLIGYQQLVSQTVNFQGYLREFVRSFQSLRFFDHLIDSPCSVTDEDYRGVIIASAFDHIRNVLTQEPNSCIALLGDFGIGKTTLGLQLTSFLAQKHLESPVHNRVPIHIDLKNHKTGARIEETIVQSMRVHYGIKWDMQAFSFLRQSNQLIFVLDGLDEMAAKADLTAVNENIREIVDLASGKSALVVTCRTHFFKSIVDESKLTVFRTVYLLPWRRQELIKYLRKRFGNEYVDVLRKIDNVFNLEELAQTPIFLDMIVETLPAIEDSKKPINSPDLYEHYTQRWITKQEIRRGSVLSHEDKETLMEVLAYEMLTRDELRIDYRELNTVLTDVLEVDRSFLTAVSNDIRTCTFLVRDGNYYRFSHTSFMEFFVARKYFKEILRGEVADFGKVYFKKEVFFFLLGMLRRYQDQGVDKLQKFLNACPVYRSRARIHTVFLLGDIGTSKAEQALWDVLKNDLHSRVSGHAAEALYRKYGRKDAFKVFIDLLKKEPYPREISLPKEPNIGWYSVGGSRKFSVDNSTTISFFIGALNDPICDDQNLKWYAASVLSRIENIEAYIAEDDLRVLADILKKDKLPRVRAYAATIIGNLGFADDWIVNALEFAISQDDDISVRKASETALNLLSDKTR